ncbi:MAG: hypothetical protein R3C14_42520 [Caldilineaceae bacterium]
MKSTLWFIAVFAVFMLIFAGCAPGGPPGGPPPVGSAVAPTAEPVEVLTVWHAWQGAELDVLEEFAKNYRETTGVEVELVPSESPAVLKQKLLSVTAAGAGPDVFLGYHTWADELLRQDLINAYCLPGQCPECEGDNPPNWCQLALGDFSYRITADFAIEVLCKLGQCPDSCVGSPRLCELAAADLDPKLDIPQGAFATLVGGTALPLGIPIWWEYEGVFVNPELVNALPANLEELGRAVEDEFGGVYYNRGLQFQTGLEIDTVPLPESTDPNVDPAKAGILVVSTDEFVRLQEKISQLTPLSLEDYQPQILVQGAYMNAHTQMRSQALDFVYALGDEDAQRLLFENTGHLPAYGEVLAEVDHDINVEGGVIIDGEVLGELRQYGETGVPAMEVQ